MTERRVALILIACAMLASIFFWLGALQSPTTTTDVAVIDKGAPPPAQPAALLTPR